MRRSRQRLSLQISTFLVRHSIFTFSILSILPIHVSFFCCHQFWLRKAAGTAALQDAPATPPRRLAKCLFFNREWTRSNANKAEHSFKEWVIAFASIGVHSRLLKNAPGKCCSCLLWLPQNPLCHPAQFHCFCRRTKNAPPLQGLVCFYRLFPRRCPGLSHVAPSGLYRGCHLSFQKIKSSPRRGILPGGLFGFAGSRVA